MKNKILFGIVLCGALVIGGIFSTSPKVIEADSGLPSCELYSRICHDTPGMQTNHDSGERVNGEVYMTCDGLANGSIAGQMIEIFEGQLCEHFEDDPQFGGYCVVAKCSLGMDEESPYEI